MGGEEIKKNRLYLYSVYAADVAIKVISVNGFSEH